MTFLDPSQADPQPQVCRGRLEFEHALERQQAQGLRSELEEVIGAGDKVVIVTHTPGLDALRARKADDRSVDVLTFRAGHVVALASLSESVGGDLVRRACLTPAFSPTAAGHPLARWVTDRNGI